MGKWFLNDALTEWITPERALNMLFQRVVTDVASIFVLGDLCLWKDMKIMQDL